MDKKKICIVSSQCHPHVGGVENYVSHLSRELVARGHEVTVVTSSMPGEPPRKTEGGVEIVRLPSWGLMDGRFPVLHPSRALRAWAQEFRSRKYDICLVNMRFFTISLFAVRLAKKCGVRAVMLDHGSSHLNTGGKLTSKLGELFEHAITRVERRYVSDFAGVSKESLRWLSHFGIRASLLLSNAVDPEEIEGMIASPSRSVRKELSIPPRAVVVSFVGRLTLEKGADKLARAVDRITKERADVHLVLAGGGYLEKEISALGNPNIHLLGQVPLRDVVALQTESDIFCLPSFSEGFPTCVLEAAVCRTFTITTARGDAKEVLKDESFGVILEDNDEERVYSALLSVLDREDDRRAAAEKTYSEVVSHYTWKNTADAFLRLLE